MTPKKPLNPIKRYFNRNKTSIQEIVREPTSGGIVFRNIGKGMEILLIQDAKDRWTNPKGHIEEGETAQQTAKREIAEEAGLENTDVLGWLWKNTLQISQSR
jgi:8-oxo-dGTP pyrophosphatase MutT (NUDIX family)